MMIKEMYSIRPRPARAPTYDKLLATKYSSAVMVRDSKGSYDGWFWGWYGWGRIGLERRTGRLKQTSPYPNGSRPVLHQLPRVGERQLDVLVV